MATWSLAYDGFDPDLQRLREALCTLSNGYFATRGAVPEARSDGVHYPGTYVAGLYNRLQVIIRAGASGAEAVELEVETSQSSVRIAQAARTRVLRDGARVAAPRALINADGYVGHALTIDLAEGRPVTVEKIVTLYTSRDRAISESLVDARLAVMRAESFQVLFARHARVWNRLWNRFDIRLDSAHEQAEPALHLHIFHLLQTVSPNTIHLDVVVSPRGWAGAP